MTMSLSRTASTCLSCLRQGLAAGVGRFSTVNTVASAIAIASARSPILTHVRGKTKGGRPKDQGVLVRLLRDIKYYGPKDTVLRVARGRMRSLWYPKKKAEYLTDARWGELGLTEADIGQRDPSFDKKTAAQIGTVKTAASVKEGTPAAGIGGTVGVEVGANTPPPRPPPQEVARLVESLLPPVLVFYRYALTQETEQRSIFLSKPPPLAPRPRVSSPLVTSDASVTAGPEAVAFLGRMQEWEDADKERKREFDLQNQLRKEMVGNVTLSHVASSINGHLRKDPRGAHMRIEESDLVFFEHETTAPSTDAIRMFGRHEVLISIPAGRGGQDVPSIRRSINVVELDMEEGSLESLKASMKNATV